MTDMDLLNGCDICGEGHSTEQCPELNMDETIINLDQLATRARLTLPPYLLVEEKSNGLVGVMARETVKKKTQLGPYEAKRTTHIFDDVGFFTLRLLATDGTSVCLDTTDENECNWLCLVRAALSTDDQNCMAYQLGSNIFYSTTRDVLPGEELFVWYAPHFARKLGKPSTPDGITRVLLGHRIEPLMSDMVIEEIEAQEESASDPRQPVFVPPVNQETQAGETTVETPAAGTEEPKPEQKQAQVLKGFYCPRCGGTFSSQSQMVLHLRKHVIQAAKEAQPAARRPGRPRKHPVPDPDLPRRSRGRPRKSKIFETTDNVDSIPFKKTPGTYQGFRKKRQIVEACSDESNMEIEEEEGKKKIVKDDSEDGDDNEPDVYMDIADIDDYFPKKEVKVSIVRTQPRRSNRGRHHKFDEDFYYPTEKKPNIQDIDKSSHVSSDVGGKDKLAEGSTVGSSGSGDKDSNGKKVVQVKVGINPVTTPWWKKRGRQPKKQKERVEILEWTGDNLEVDKERLTADMVKESLAALKGQNAVIMVEINELKKHGTQQPVDDISGKITSGKNSENDVSIPNNEADISEHQDNQESDQEQVQEISDEQSSLIEGNNESQMETQAEVNNEDCENVVIINTESFSTGAESVEDKLDEGDNEGQLDTEKESCTQQVNNHVEIEAENETAGEHQENNVDNGKCEEATSTKETPANESCTLQSELDDTDSKHENKGDEKDIKTIEQKGESPSRSKEIMFQIEKLEADGADKGSLVMMFEETADGQYGCMLCNEKFTEEINAISHFMEHSQKENEPCIVCGKTFDAFNDLLEHRKECVLKDASADTKETGSGHEGGNFECDVCHQTFKSAPYLYRHMLIHTDIFCCIKCKKTFSRKDSMQKHVLKCCPDYAADYGIYYCENCHRVFSKKGGLQRHQTKCKSVKCATCNKVYASHKEIEFHKCERSENEETAKFACGQCYKSFQSMYYLNQHLRMHKNMYLCNRCGRNMSNQDDLDSHTVQCETLENIRMFGSGACVQCNTRFNNSKQFRDHALTHTHPFHCELCGKRFIKMSSWKVHECVTNANTFACFTCKKDFRSEASLEKHIVNEECMIYSCKGCKSKFHLKTTAREHVDICELVTDTNDAIVRKNEMQEVCSVCGKTFASKSNLTKHMVLHGAKRYQCPHCEKKFHLDVYLKEHIGCVHYNIFRFQCNTCGRMLKSKTGLMTHIKMFHSPDSELYSCPTCGKAFKQKGNLKAHMFSHSSERQFLCESCPKSFKFPDQLSRHRREHKYTFKLSCPHCQKEFIRGYDLKRHLQVDHGNCIYVCDICNARASQRHTLVRHFKRKHPDKVSDLTNKEYVNSMWKDVSTLDGTQPSSKINQMMAHSQAIILPQDVADALQNLGVGTASARDIQILKEKGLITETTENNVIVPQDSFIIENEGDIPDPVENTVSEQETSAVVSSDVGSVDMVGHDDGTFTIAQVSGLPNAVKGLENGEGQQIVILQIVDPENQDKTVEILQDLSAFPQGLHVLNHENRAVVNIQQGELTAGEQQEGGPEHPSHVTQKNQVDKVEKEEEMIVQDEDPQMIEQGQLIQHGTIVNDGLIQDTNSVQDNGFQTGHGIDSTISEGQDVHDQSVLLHPNSKTIISDPQVYTIISTEEGPSEVSTDSLQETGIEGQGETTMAENTDNIEEHPREVLNIEDHPREVINIEEHSGETIEHCEINHEGEMITAGETIESTEEFIDHTGEIIQGQIIQTYGHLMDRPMESVLIQDDTVQTELMQ